MTDMTNPIIIAMGNIVSQKIAEKVGREYVKENPVNVGFYKRCRSMGIFLHRRYQDPFMTSINLIINKDV